MYFWFLALITIGALNVQTLAQIIGIVFSDNQRVAVFFSVGAFVFAFLFSNFTSPTKEFHYMVKIICNFSTIKLVLESILILHYGFDRCADNELSSVLYMYNLEDQQLVVNIRYLFLEMIAFRFVALIALLAKVNPLVTRKTEQQKIAVIVETIKKRKASKVLIPGLIPERLIQSHSV